MDFAVKSADIDIVPPRLYLRRGPCTRLQLWDFGFLLSIFAYFNLPHNSLNWVLYIDPALDYSGLELDQSKMSTGEKSPKRELTPTIPTTLASIPQKRVLEDDHQPAVSSPLNPDFKAPKPEDVSHTRDGRVSRPKKESLKKRESKAGSHAPDSSARATPDPKSNIPQKQKRRTSIPAPIRYKLPPPKATDFESPRGPVFIAAHTKTAPDGSEIHFNETTDQ
jgi:hypothetical protein